MDEYNDDQVKIKTSSIANGSGSGSGDDIKIDIVESDPDIVLSSDPKVASSLEITSDSKVSNVLVEFIQEIQEEKFTSSSKCNIYKVPKSFRSVKPESYTPQMISIGPFHYGKRGLHDMEEYKLSYLQSFLSRVNLNLENVVELVTSWEEEAHNCYAETIYMNSYDFLKLILVDGCFLVQYFIWGSYPEFVDEINHLLHESLSSDLFSDFMMLENQLPFFVLEGLFQLYPFYDTQKPVSFSNLIHHIFPRRYKNQNKIPNVVSGRQNIGNHFVSELWRYFIPDPPRPPKKPQQGVKYRYLRPPTATELHEAGVIFKRAEKKHLGDVIAGITFKNGVLEIPHIKIFDEFETYLRNLIAFEQCHLLDYYVTHFAFFMDDLINTDRDVSLLIKGGIISNHLGNNKDVSKLFNNICKQVNIGSKYYYNDVCEEIQKYCEVRCHRWMASLRRDYFNTPWAFISFTAAVVLLLLTLIQTIFSGLAINK